MWDETKPEARRIHHVFHVFPKAEQLLILLKVGFSGYLGWEHIYLFYLDL